MKSINFYVTLYSQFIRNDILDFFSHASNVSLGFSFIPSIQRLFLQDLSSNSINFAHTSTDNLFRRSVVLFTLEFISSLMLLPAILNSSMIYF